MIPLISGLVGALIGAGATLGGTIFTQRRLDSREDARWHRESARDRLVRSIDHRRSVYADFVSRCQEVVDATVSGTFASEGHEGVARYMVRINEANTAVHIVGSRGAAGMARRTYRALVKYVRVHQLDDSDHREVVVAAQRDEVAESLVGFIERARADLDVPD